MSVGNNAETVGRLLATSTLMKGERELLRKQEEPTPETAKPGLRPAPAAHFPRFKDDCGGAAEAAR